jgi:peroxiredoxin
MSLTPSNMLALGTIAPSFSLPDVVSANILTLAALKSDKATVVMFICNHCPYVQHIIDKVVRVAQSYQEQGVAFIAINSNDTINYPLDSPEKMREFSAAHHFTFPYLFDESQEVAKAYQAACTPDFFVFDANLSLVYRGRFDGATPGNKIEITGNELRDALDHLLRNEPINSEQKPSIGCNIKWK